MSIEALLAAVPPPDEPYEAFSGPWGAMEASLRTPLPPDYKDFVRHYGSGYFMEFLGVHVPRSKNPNVQLGADLDWPLAVFRDVEDVPYRFWPAVGGLLLFGQTDNGDMLFWLMEGSPEDWRVVVWDRGLGGFEVFDCDLTGFLAGLATGDITPEAFPEDLLPCERLFQPSAPDPEVEVE